MNASEIYKIIQNNRSNYNYFGLRAQTQNPVTGKYDVLSVGDMPANSYNWDDGETTGEELRGVCALGIDIDANENEIKAAINKVQMYDDRAQVILIGSYYGEYGYDDGEIVMYGNETVIGEWRK